MDDRRKNYRAWDAHQNRHDSNSPQDALPDDDLVFFLFDLIPEIDLHPFTNITPRDARPTPVRRDHDWGEEKGSGGKGIRSEWHVDNPKPWH